MKRDKQMNKITVYQTTSNIIGKLSKTMDTSVGRSTLAKLRYSIGKNPSETIEVWPLMLESMPDEFLGCSGRLTAEEQAILNTLQLYALYHQGKVDTVAPDKENSKWENMGTSFSTLRTGDGSVSADRRFNTLITSATYDELLYHLRQMVGLLKSKSKGNIAINFPKLSQDLFWFLLSSEDNVRIAWSREYYRNRTIGKDENEGEKNEQ